MTAQPTADPHAADRKALEEFIVDSDDLQNLETLIGNFNLFEAIGAVRNELRHSDFLAFLLDPSRPHGLGDSFLRRLLQAALRDVGLGKAPISPVELDVLDFDDADVRREWSNIDILVLDNRAKLAVIIENKIDSGEHSEQLQRYWAIVEKEYPEHGILAFYLTPGGDEPSDDRYVRMPYKCVAKVVQRFVQTGAETIGPDVHTLLRHYEQMLERHIVSDSDIAELCRNLYRKHRQALDLIYAHRPDPTQDVVRDFIEKLVNDDASLALDDSTRAYLRFAPKRWDASPILTKGAGWTRSGRILLFQFLVAPANVLLRLYIGPGPVETRDRLFKFAQGHPVFQKNTKRSLEAKWNQIFLRPFFAGKDLAVESPDEIRELVTQRWTSFVTNDLPKIVAAFDSEAWLWASPADAAP